MHIPVFDAMPKERKSTMKKLFALWAAALLMGCSAQGPGASGTSVEQANTRLVLEF